MMYLLNKIVWEFLNPAMQCLIVAVICFALHRFRIMRILGGLSIIWLWLWCTPLMTNLVGRSLERGFVLQTEDGLPRMREVADYPACDVIVDLGGGTGSDTNFFSGVALNSSADRVYFSALLWKAEKAPIVIPSGKGCTRSDGQLLKDLGVSESAIVVDDEARNTEENAKFVARMFSGGGVEKVGGGGEKVGGESRWRMKESGGGKVAPRILLVTSAWHMKRSLLMFEKYAPEIEVVPAPCDFECINGVGGGFSWSMLLPSFEIAGRNAVYFHEWLGYWWYKYVR